MKKLTKKQMSIFDGLMISRMALHNFAKIFKDSCPIEFYKYKFDFGQYLDKDYFKNSFARRSAANAAKIEERNNIMKSNIRKVG